MSASFELFELSCAYLKKFVQNEKTLRESLTDRDKANVFFGRFPFAKFVNITTIERESLFLGIKILNVLSTYDPFYLFEEPFNHTMEFILMNLALIRSDCEEITCMLELLLKMLSHVSSSLVRSRIDMERLLQILLSIMQIKDLNSKNYSYFSIILKFLLENRDSILGPNLMSFISTLFDKLQECGAFREMGTICKHVLDGTNSYKIEFHNIFQWIAVDCFTLIDQSQDENLLGDLFGCINLMLVKFDDEGRVDTHNCRKSLLRVSSTICTLSQREPLRTLCISLLQLNLLAFLQGENCPEYAKEQILHELSQLPVDVDKWPESNLDVFFWICHMLVANSKSIWTRSNVLKAVSEHFYGRRFSNLSVFKAIYYLFSDLICNNGQEHDARVIGDDLLAFFAKYGDSPSLFSYSMSQLRWILRDGCKSLKVKTLYYWLKNTEGTDDSIILAIRESNCEKLIIYVMVYFRADKEVGLKSSNLIRKLGNARLSTQITLLLPEVLHMPQVFIYLILSEPKVPTNLNQSLLICKLMGAVITTVKDPQVLKGVCVFSTKLLNGLKRHSESIQQFCCSVSSVQFLIKSVSSPNDDVAIEAVNLLNTILNIQKSLKMDLGPGIEDDFTAFLTGSDQKVSKSMSLLSKAASFNKSLVKLNPKCGFSVYLKLMEFCNNENLKSRSYECIARLFVKCPLLTQALDSWCHVEICCSQTISASSAVNLLKMVEIWLKMVRYHPYNNFRLVPDLVIRNFLHRASQFDPKALDHLRVLEDLVEKQVSWTRTIKKGQDLW